MMKLVKNGKPKKNLNTRKSVNDQTIEFMNLALNQEKKISLYIDEAIMCGVKIKDFYQHIKGINEDYDTPSLDEALKENGVALKTFYKPDEFADVHQSLSKIIYQALSKDSEYTGNNTYFSFENIKSGITNLFPDPNIFIEKYKLLHRWKEDGLEDKALSYWLLNISSYSNKLSIAQKAEKELLDIDYTFYKKKLKRIK